MDYLSNPNFYIRRKARGYIFYGMCLRKALDAAEYEYYYLID